VRISSACCSKGSTVIALAVLPVVLSEVVGWPTAL
jgi:hypothetical protein